MNEAIKYQGLLGTLQAVANAAGQIGQQVHFLSLLIPRLAGLVPCNYLAVAIGPEDAPGQVIEQFHPFPEQISPNADFELTIVPEPAASEFHRAFWHHYHHSIETGADQTWDASACPLGTSLARLRYLFTLPLRRQGQMIGLLCLGRTAELPFTELEQLLAADHSLLLVIALEHYQALQQQNRVLQETQALLAAAQSILGAEDLPTICQNLDSAFHRLVQADHSVLYLVDHAQRRVILRATDGIIENELSYDELEAGISGIVFRTGQPVLSLDADDGIEPEATRQRRKDFGTGAVIVVPLISKGQVLGTFTAVNRREHRLFNAHDVELLMVLATNATAAIQNVSLLDNMRIMSSRLKILSYQDTMTGLFNRGYFEQQLRQMEHAAAFPISIIILDVDGLKPVNDHFGHAAGDELLRTLASIIQAVFRKEDVAARIGGDEFGILLADTDQSSVQSAVERLQQAIRTYNQAQAAGPGAIRLQASIGAATGFKGSRLADIQKEADNRMYQEKRAHRQTGESHG